MLFLSHFRITESLHCTSRLITVYLKRAYVTWSYWQIWPSSAHFRPIRLELICERQSCDVNYLLYRLSFERHAFIAVFLFMY